MSDLSSNPLAKRVAMVECAGGNAKPRLEITFETIDDMHAASDFIRRAADETSVAQPEPIHTCETRSYCEACDADTQEPRRPSDRFGHRW